MVFENHLNPAPCESCWILDVLSANVMLFWGLPKWKGGPERLVTRDDDVVISLGGLTKSCISEEKSIIIRHYFN